MNALSYIFSNDWDWGNPTLYVVSPCKGAYVQQTFVHKPWLRKTTTSKNEAFWVRRNVALDLVSKLQDIGYPNAKVEKVHWWNVLLKQDLYE